MKSSLLIFPLISFFTLPEKPDAFIRPTKPPPLPNNDTSEQPFVPIKGQIGHTISHVTERLLTVGIVDPDPKIRYSVLRSLDSRFDLHLAQSENIRRLPFFFALIIFIFYFLFFFFYFFIFYLFIFLFILFIFYFFIFFLIYLFFFFIFFYYFFFFEF
jgi:hypothetical protein